MKFSTVNQGCLLHVKNWLAEFKHGINSVVVRHHVGRPTEATSTENVQIVNEVLNKERPLSVVNRKHQPTIHAGLHVRSSQTIT